MVLIAPALNTRPTLDRRLSLDRCAQRGKRQWTRAALEIEGFDGVEVESSFLHHVENRPVEPASPEHPHLQAIQAMLPLLYRGIIAQAVLP